MANDLQITDYRITIDAGGADGDEMFTSPELATRRLLLLLTPAQRLDLFAEYCLGCGTYEGSDVCPPEVRGKVLDIWEALYARLSGMTLERAVEILNERAHHGTDSWHIVSNGPSRWVQHYGSNNCSTNGDVLRPFEAVAVAEKYQRGGQDAEAS